MSKGALCLENTKCQKNKVVYITKHYINSKKMAGSHFLANALKNLGYNVIFITAVFSLIKLYSDWGQKFEKGFIRNIFAKRTYGGIESIINTSLLHPINIGNKIIERFTSHFFFLNKKSILAIKAADIIVFESTPALLFFEKVKRINPDAKIIYRMADDLEKIKMADTIIECERKNLKKFNLVSVPTKKMHEKFLPLTPNNLYLQYHGIDKNLYDRENENPYNKDKINHVFAGNAYLDNSFLDIASSIFPDHTFHIIGPFQAKTKRSNVVFYGTMKFEDTIPFIKFADIGLQIMTNSNNVASTFADSLKMIQYTYCKMPIVAPNSIPAMHRKNVFFYEYGDKASIKKCILSCLAFDRFSFYEPVNSWDDLAKEMIDIVSD